MTHTEQILATAVAVAGLGNVIALIFFGVHHRLLFGNIELTAKHWQLQNRLNAIQQDRLNALEQNKFTAEQQKQYDECSKSIDELQAQIDAEALRQQEATECQK